MSSSVKKKRTKAKNNQKIISVLSLEQSVFLENQNGISGQRSIGFGFYLCNTGQVHRYMYKYNGKGLR